MPATRELLTALYDAFNARDLDAALAAMHPEVDWPNGWEGGRVFGRDDGRRSTRVPSLLRSTRTSSGARR
jgi:hypothetical protein